MSKVYDRFEIARLKFKPEIIKFLFIAETPPKSDSNRFFYFENVEKQDSLFLETMKALYPLETQNVETREIRRRKEEFLNSFKNDGFYLVDSLDKPFDEKYSSDKKIRLIKEGQYRLLEKIKPLISIDTKVILIAAPVYRANFQYLKENGIPVINNELIDFPGSGGQKKFREKLRKVIELNSL